MKKIKIIKHENKETTEPTMWVVKWNEERKYLVVTTIQQSLEYDHDCFFYQHPNGSYPIAYAPNEASAMRVAQMLSDAKESLNEMPAPYGEEFEVMEHTRELTRKAISVWEPASRMVY